MVTREAYKMKPQPNQQTYSVKLRNQSGHSIASSQPKDVKMVITDSRNKVYSPTTKTTNKRWGKG
jgi:hypothetical protein